VSSPYQCCEEGPLGRGRPVKSHPARPAHSSPRARGLEQAVRRVAGRRRRARRRPRWPASGPPEAPQRARAVERIHSGLSGRVPASPVVQ
jgi:hypothetical protein